MENILTEHDINRLFSTTSPEFGNYQPLDIDILPSNINFNDDRANEAYNCLLEKFRRWNKL